jgi:hypothetical protein
MKTNRITPRLILTSLAMLVCMTAFEFIKQYLIPDIEIWESHVMTIAFSAIIACITSFIVLRRFKSMNVALSLKKEESDMLHAELTGKVAELQDALANIKTLSGLLPICASCKRIRDDKGSWKQIEEYIASHSEADFSHGICPDCAHRLYPDLFEKNGTIS